jgi:hypothetical protein
MYSLSLKMLGGVAVGLVYQLYYGGGDTTNYYLTAKGLEAAFYYKFDAFWTMLVNDPENKAEVIMAYSSVSYRHMMFMPYLRDPNAYMVVRFIFIPLLFSLGTYLACSLIISSFSFIGIWCIFRVFSKRFPKYEYYIAISVLFIPSVFFWGSGILKDSIMMGCLGILFYTFDICFIQKRINIPLILISVFLSYIVFTVKAYILLSFVPFLILWQVVNVLNGLKSQKARIILTPIILLVGIGGSVGLLNALGASSDRFSTDKLLETAVVVKEDLNRSEYYADGRGSSYDLGEFDGSPVRALQLMIPAINVTLFRPYLWEARNPFMLISAIESFVLFLIFADALRRAGSNLLSIIRSNPLLIFSLGFSLAFSFMVGLSTGNFGNLVRYKIPAVPFFVASVFIVRGLAMERNEAQQARKAQMRERDLEMLRRRSAEAQRELADAPESGLHPA